MKSVTIIRGVSGSGKTTFGEYLTQGKSESEICCADDYFTDEHGVYNFEIESLGKAHEYCKDKFADLIYSKGCDDIVVNNTSTRESEFSFYKTLAEENGYRVFVIVMENWHGNTDVHSAPDGAKDLQEKRLRSSFKPR